MSMFSHPVFTNITALNVGLMALGIVPETYSVNASVPKRDFAGYTNITYYLYRGVFEERSGINSGTTINIPAGVVFKSSMYYRGIIVNGGIILDGTSSQPVVFTEERDDSFGNPGDTNGDGSFTAPEIYPYYRWLDMTDVSDDSVSSLRYGVFRYQGRGIDLGQASPKISHCTFDKDDWGIQLNGVSHPIVDSCTFNNLTYAPLHTSLVSYPRSTLGNSISGSTYRAIGVITETLVQDATLVKRTFAGIHNIPYIFNNYMIGTGATLTIEPGVILKFFPNASLDVKRGLIAEGGAHPDSTIVFTELSDDFYGGDTNADSTLTTPCSDCYPTSWLGILFEDESLDPLCRLKHCVVRYAGNYYYMYPGISAINASPTITYSTISKNSYGIVAGGASNPIMHYCDIYQNTHLGINNANQSFMIDARFNWWGNNTGPSHIDNPGGTGDVASDGLSYTPFLTTGAQIAIAGDVSLNGNITSYDASLILKYVVDSVGNEFNDAQKRAADVSGAMGITPNDASLVLQYVVGKITSFPVEVNHKSGHQNFFPNVVASSIEIGKFITHPGALLTIPIRMTGLNNLQAAQIIMAYDTTLFSPLKVTLESPPFYVDALYKIFIGKCIHCNGRSRCCGG